VTDPPPSERPDPAEAVSPVLAAGGVIWRRGADGQLEVVLVHRPRYDDWSLPKGKVDPGESDEHAALREVEEETTVQASLGPELPTTLYLDRSGKQKRVRYWAMTVCEGSPTGANEVDQAVWVRLSDVPGQLSYVHDAEVVAALPGTLGEV
jgi:8-oxo-dGTP diphosphatase